MQLDLEGSLKKHLFDQESRDADTWYGMRLSMLDWFLRLSFLASVSPSVCMPTPNAERQGGKAAVHVVLARAKDRLVGNGIFRGPTRTGGSTGQYHSLSMVEL